ncbi:structural maintenance of chromosomes protein 3-like [Sitodiplosis mosellana]|uniref:structural maintenance of chromosomes protein 3-like n=1 Tax=Sitodiplosis mosellana TaxID=263140 RepID=UPI0024446FBC|nr:structural maintenance of chromosomes protein 3-like [Sitodiplosis mosellana]
MRIEKVLIVDSKKDNENFVLGPIDGVKSAILIGDTSKSAWLKAITFALGYSNELNSLPREFRNFNGSVELTLNFENSVQNDTTKAFFKSLGNIQTGNKILLRRSIQSQQIEYFLNNGLVERLDVKNFLQTFNFSPSYPFQYSVHSDDIALVELSDDADRLQFLKNCCGVDEFCVKRDKSIRILKETEEQIRKIDVSLMKINLQLEIFASNEKQQIYQDWVKREKELGHFKRLYRIKKMQAELQQRKADIDKQTNAIAVNKNAIIQNAENSKEVRRQIKLISDSLNALRMDERQLVSEIEQSEHAKHSLEATIVDLQGFVQQGSLNEEFSIHMRQVYREKIDQTSSQIGDIDAEIERIAERKHIIDQQVSELEARVASIVMNCQQNQRLGTQFQSVDKRNEHLSVLVKRAKNAIARENRNVNRLKGEIQQEMEELKRLSTARTEHNEQLAEMNVDDETQSFYQQQNVFENLENQRCELVEQNESLLEKSMELKLNLEQVYDKLRSRIGNSIFDGFKSMETLMQKATNELKCRYFGRVIDNFSCDDPVKHELLPNLMGVHLFYHIVDSAETATQILSRLNAANLPGEVNFFALDIIDSYEFDENDVVSSLTFDAKFQKVFEKICCESPSNPKDMANRSNDTISVSSLDSGFIEENGAIIGVELATDINSMELYQQHQDLADMEEATRYELSENSYRMDSTMEQISETSTTLEQQHQAMSHIQQVQSSVAQITKAINLCEMRIQTKQTELEKHETKVNGLAEAKNRYETEMKSELLTERETKSIESVEIAIVAKKVELQQVIAEIKNWQKKRDTIFDYHENSLMTPYSVLEEQSRTHSDNLAELNRQTEMLLQSEEAKRQAAEELVQIRRQVAALRNEHESKRVALKDSEQEKITLEQSQTYLFAALDDMKLQVQNLSTALIRLREQKPYDATHIHNPDIVQMSEEDIDNHLSIARYQLKTYENTDNFDLNMLDTFTKERENFMRRRFELTQMESKISQAMAKMEASIKTSIRNTFYELAKHFSTNFKRFVPRGAGKLQLIEAASAENDDALMQNRNQEAIGLNIFARFDQSEDQFDHLFGQKRRVVALVFIISMQQLCPAPFYLIDCIEELIFYPYLEPLIIYLNELSNGSQIIATSSSHRMLNGPNFIDNIFRSTACNGIPQVERIPYAEVEEEEDTV